MQDVTEKEEARIRRQGAIDLSNRYRNKVLSEVDDRYSSLLPYLDDLLDESSTLTVELSAPSAMLGTASVRSGSLGDTTAAQVSSTGSSRIPGLQSRSKDIGPLRTPGVTIR